MSLTCMQTATYRHAFILTEDDKTDGRMKERKENIQFDRVTKYHKKYAYRRKDGHTDGRTHRQTVLELVDRQTETYTKL